MQRLQKGMWDTLWKMSIKKDEFLLLVSETQRGLNTEEFMA